MGRTNNNDAPRPHLPPIEKIELSNDHKMWRLAAVIFLMLFGAAALVYALVGFMSADAGWQRIEASSSAETNCSGDFVLLYNIGAGDTSANAEMKALTSAYTNAAIRAYQLYSADEGFDGVHNVYYINRHPNEAVEVDSALYQAFSLVQRHENRSLYLAPVYCVFNNIFYCDTDAELADFDPLLNDGLRADFAVMAAYGRDCACVDLRLLGDDRVMLYVSDEYLAYAEAEGIEDFIDFYWMKNAFIVDYLAEALILEGYTFGAISSYDGFVRNLDNVSESDYSFNIFDRAEQSGRVAAVMEYTGRRSIVLLRDFPLNSRDYQHYYRLSNGETRTAYLDPADGLSKSALPALAGYSSNLGCAEILLRLVPIYIAERFDEAAVAALTEDDLYSVYCRDGTVCYNDPSLVLSQLYAGEDMTYSASYTGPK